MDTPPHPVAALESKLDQRLTAQDIKLDKIMVCLQGPDPLNCPGEGLVGDVRRLRDEKQDRDKFVKRMKALGWSGAAAGLGGLILSGIEWAKAHIK